VKSPNQKKPVAKLTSTSTPCGSKLGAAWIRHARLDGASWDLVEIPLSETQELYQVKIFSGANLLSQEQVPQTQWRCSAAMQALDGAHGPLELQVAQLSESFGPGLFRKHGFTI